MKILTFIIVLLVSTQVGAHKFEVGLGGLLTVSNDELNSGTGFIIFSDYVGHKTIGARVSVTRFKAENDQGYMYAGKNTVIMLEGSLILRYDNSYVTPFLGFGPSYVLFDYKISDRARATSGFDYIYGDLKNAMGFHLLAGANIHLAPRLSMAIGARYQSIKPEHYGSVMDFDPFYIGGDTKLLDLGMLSFYAGLTLPVLSKR